MEVKGAVFLVTGASRGIGRGLARVLAADGARLALAARSTGPLEALAEELRGAGAEARALAGDVGADEDARRIVAEATRTFGRVDVLVNNAGILLARGPVRETPARAWEATLRTNVVGVANMVRHALPGMERRRRGVILNLSSGWGREAAPLVAPYCASKFAVEALTRSLSQETGPGVIVFALNPGVVATRMLETAFEDAAARYPAPDDLAPRWRRLFAALDASWHGTSRDLLEV